MSAAVNERARQWRNLSLRKGDELRDRHRDELELALQTTLSGAQYALLLQYLQALRDWPETEGFPLQPPAAPAFFTTAPVFHADLIAGGVV